MKSKAGNFIKSSHFKISFMSNLKFLFLSGYIFWLSGLAAQNDEIRFADVELGGFYSLVIDKEFMEDSVFYAGFVNHYINLHLRNQISERWYIGGEVITAIVMSSEPVESPFFLFGVHGEYKVFSGRRARLFCRLGVSSGDLSYAEPGVPERRLVANVAFGASLEIFIASGISVDVGYYNHSPLNRIPNSYSAAMPFLGVHYRIRD